VIYLSCLELNLDRAEARRWVGNPYFIHQRLLKAWPDGASGRVLFRVELDRRSPRILVQAPEAAEWERAFADFPVLVGPPRQKEVALPLVGGQALRFLLRANPTVRRLQFEGKVERVPSGERVGLLREEEQLAWLRRKAEEAGADLLAADVRNRGEQVSFRPATRTRIVHQCAEFEGRLRVTEPERLAQAVGEGIGPAKAFGFGLLSLAPAAS
jgi:CRISPR system Cascade subunit CasE